MKLNQEQFRDYLKAVFLAQGQHREWRKGQLYFNVLYRMFPDCADDIGGTPDDPFHRDDIIPVFLTKIMEPEGS